MFDARARIFTLPAWIVVGALFGAGCVDTRPPPALPKQAEVRYGPKVFLVDATVGAEPTQGSCTRLGMVRTGTSATATVTVAATDGVKDAVGLPLPINRRVPHNCYVDVKPKALRADVVEVTNELFQLCVDSGVCDAPDPSKASKGSGCSIEDQFDKCPVAEVTQVAASTFCKFIGRRLPSGVEHIIMRQGGLGADVTQDPTKITVFPNGKDETWSPARCDDAVVGVAGCRRAQPITIGGDTRGAASGDAVAVPGTSFKIYDLIGNVSEWSSDLVPSTRGNAAGLPWFCQARLPSIAGQPPTCPTGAVCVRGQYQPLGFPIKPDWPVCVGFGSLSPTSGQYGTLFGGSFQDDKADRLHLGTFARRVEKNPTSVAEAVKWYGFRCAGDLGVDDAVEAR